MFREAYGSRRARSELFRRVCHEKLGKVCDREGRVGDGSGEQVGRGDSTLMLFGVGQETAKVGLWLSRDDSDMGLFRCEEQSASCPNTVVAMMLGRSFPGAELLLLPQRQRQRPDLGLWQEGAPQGSLNSVWKVRPGGYTQHGLREQPQL